MSEYALTFRKHGEPWRDDGLPPEEFGRLLTVPEINRIRRGYDARDISNRTNPWWLTYITSSLEYHGTSPGGVEVIAVRHGDGPSQAELDDDPGAFRRLLDGAYGRVDVVERKAVEWWRRRGRRGNGSPLGGARLGGDDEAHALMKQASFRCGTSRPHEFHHYVREPNSATDKMSFRPNGGVQRLVLSSLLNLQDGSLALLTALQADSRDIGDGYFFALAQGRTVVDMAPPASAASILPDPGSDAWIEEAMSGDAPFHLIDVDGTLMTNASGYMDSGVPSGRWPAYRVLAFEPIGEPVRINWHRFADRVARHAGDANCYRLVDDDPLTYRVQYGRGEFDTSRRLPSITEIRDNWGLRAAISRRAAARWWEDRSLVISAGART